MIDRPTTLTETTKLYLRPSSTFQGLSADQLSTFRTYLDVTRFADGNVLFHEGEPAENLYVIRRGRIEIQKEQDDVAVCIAERRQGSIVGECSLLESGVRSTTAISRGPCECYALSRSNFLRLAKDHPGLAMWVVGSLAERIREADNERFRHLQQQHKSLMEAHDYLRMQLLDRAPYPIIVFDSSSRVLLANPAATALFGDLESGALLHDYVRAASRSPEATGGEGNASSQTSSGEMALRRRDDQEIFCRFAVSHILNESGESNGLLILEDVTEKHLMERQATEREHLAMKGEMAAEIAHSLNNYLTVLHGSTELLHTIPFGEHQQKIDRCLQRMGESLDQMQVFVSGLLDVHHPHQQKVSLDLNRFLQNQIVFLQPQTRFKRITFETDFDETIPLLEVDAANLQQVFYNLVLNASEALRDAEITHPLVEVRTRANRERHAITLVVSDNGPGIDATLASRLFAERVTTKPTGHGFGLITIKRIVDEWGGSITVMNRPDGLGAEFCLLLPMSRLQFQKASHNSAPAG